MKNIILPLTVLPFLSFSQKIKLSEVDKFEKVQRIETDNVIIVRELNTAADVQLRSVGKSSFLLLRGLDGVIGANDSLSLLLATGNKVKLAPTGIQTNLSRGTFQYKINGEEIETLAKNKITDFRFVTTTTFLDKSVSSKNGEKLLNLFTVFLAEYRKWNTN